MKKFYPLKNNQIQIIKNEHVSLKTMRHVHESFVIGLVTENKLILEKNGKAEIIDKNHFFVIPPYTAHSANPLPNEKVSYVCAVFKSFPNTDSAISYYVNNGAIIPKPLKHFIVQWLIHENYKTMNKWIVKKDIVNKMIYFIQENYLEKITLQNMSKKFSANPFYLQKCFLKNTGLTPLEYQTVIKLKKAKKDIENGYPIIYAALENGFYDQCYFSKKFKKWMGVTPAYYQKEYKNNLYEK